MKPKDPINICWLRRDLRLNDNAALFHALKEGKPVLPVFIFDEEILHKLPKEDARVSLLIDIIGDLKNSLQAHGSDLRVYVGKPKSVFEQICDEFSVAAVFANEDYEPYARERDAAVARHLKSIGASLNLYKDQVIFDPTEVLKDDGTPYTVFTPYSRKWLQRLGTGSLTHFASERHFAQLLPIKAQTMLTHKELGFSKLDVAMPPTKPDMDIVRDYDKTRDLPAIDGTSRLGFALRFGLISIRKLVGQTEKVNATFLKELIWREFFMSILHHFPYVAEGPFKPRYANIAWRNNEKEFAAWCAGKTGYPMVDAGMRQMNETGFMHNRVRMLTASFLSKHLLINWQWGEAYFAEKLLDYELSSNNGNWQWAAGCGCDAAPYFRIFNPSEQQKKFDPELKYIRKWVPEFGTSAYPEPITEHVFARERALKVYKAALQ